VQAFDCSLIMDHRGIRTESQNIYVPTGLQLPTMAHQLTIESTPARLGNMPVGGAPEYSEVAWEGAARRRR
jgi:hypothetical protein